MSLNIAVLAGFVKPARPCVAFQYGTQPLTKRFGTHALSTTIASATPVARQKPRLGLLGTTQGYWSTAERVPRRWSCLLVTCLTEAMILTEIDHIAIAVRDLDAAIDYYRRAFGAEVAHREIVESDGVEEALIKVADSYIQLTAATRPDSPIAKSIEKRGEGLHHVGYRVDDCAAALAAMVAAGATAIDSAPRPGSRGTTVAFIHPKGSLGTLIELVQE